MHLRAMWLLAALIAVPGIVQAQDNTRFSVGGQFTVVHLHWVDEFPGGFGGRFSYDAIQRGSFVLAPEAEVNYFPQNRFGRFGETELLAGVRAGVRLGQFGFFAKARPGLVHFTGKFVEDLHGSPSTNFAFDAGGVFEYTTLRRLTFRIDMGDTMMYAPEPFIRGLPAGSGPTGNFHNFQANFGVGFRF